MTSTQPRTPQGTRRPLAPEVRRAAARMIIAANKANGDTPDPRIVAVAEGRERERVSDAH